MWAGKAFIASIALLTLLVSPTILEGAEPPFSVSPGEITVHDAPPMGEPYTISETIVVWNRENTERLIYVTSEIPPENMITPGYEPIPNENWVRPFPSSSFVIPENSFVKIQISMNIPRWENLTGKKWEVWIGVERQALPGEIGVLRPTVRMKIETTKELPPPPGRPNYLIFLAIGVAIAIIAAGVWISSKRRKRALLWTQPASTKRFF